MKIDFTIDELKHIQYAVNKLSTLNSVSAKNIDTKISKLLAPLPIGHTRMGSSRKPA
jgi:hypothetical protein